MQGEQLTWRSSEPGTLWIEREEGWSSFTNFNDSEVALPLGEILLSSAEISGGMVPANSTVWLKLS
jgi:alpha-glucosidase